MSIRLTWLWCWMRSGLLQSAIMIKSASYYWILPLKHVFILCQSGVPVQLWSPFPKSSPPRARSLQSGPRGQLLVLIQMYCKTSKTQQSWSEYEFEVWLSDLLMAVFPGERLFCSSRVLRVRSQCLLHQKRTSWGGSYKQEGTRKILFLYMDKVDVHCFMTHCICLHVRHYSPLIQTNHRVWFTGNITHFFLLICFLSFFLSLYSRKFDRITFCTYSFIDESLRNWHE